jgi:aerobic-type carbon monoxide dehydrogenase small subunit (CoxS/CutS family)
MQLGFTLSEDTVLVDSAAVSGCLYLAVFADGAELVTVEGLADGDTLHPVQEAFIEAGADLQTFAIVR